MNNDLANIHDRSLLLLLTKNVFFIPVVKKIPAQVKPNALTLLGFSSVVLCGYFTYLSNRGFSAGYLLGALSLLVYLIADNIDGMHARNTNQTSPLGGFLDQWLDAISLLVISMSLSSVLHITHTSYLLVLFFLAMVNIILYHDQKNSGSFYKPLFGSNEFLLLVIALYLSCYLFYEAYVRFAHLVLSQHSNHLAYAVILISIGYLLKTITTAKLNFSGLIFPVACHLAVVIPALFIHMHSPVVPGIVLAIVNAIFIGKLLVCTYALPNILFFPAQEPELKPLPVRSKKKFFKG